MSLPLDSIRVLDLTRLLPGPYCTQVFADFGADVIKVEDPKLGDYARWNEPKIGSDGESAFFNSLNRNKKSVSINLKSDKGKELFLELVKTADILVESFRPGVMDRLNLGYERLKEVNPKLIYSAITGYGQDGPYASYPGHDINYLSYAGLLHLQGERHDKPVVPSVQIADIGGGALMATVGILLALQSRNQTGKGQFVDVSMMDGVISWLQTLLPGFLATGEQPKRGEMDLSGGKACYGVYETLDERYLSVGALEPKFWEGFCKGIERPDFIPLLEAPLDEQDRMKSEIESILKKKRSSEWMETFKDLGTCVAPVLDLEEMLQDPQVLHRNMIIDTKHPSLGTVKHIGIPIKLSDTAGSVRSQAPKLGEHNKDILAELGYTVEQVNEFKNEEVL
jgi:crotonobetainyl-CoA:carnitine CoA-transferase CaiB-like acyl-CoA transferase